MITLTNENSLAAKVMIREIITLIKDSLSAITAENIETYHSVLDVLQGFIIADIHCKSREEEDANITANRAIIKLTQSLLNYNLSYIDEQNRHQLTETLKQIQLFFRELENKRIISVMNRMTVTLIDIAEPWQLKKVTTEIFLHTTNQFKIFLQEHLTSNSLNDEKSTTQFFNFFQNLQKLNAESGLSEQSKLLNLLSMLEKISQHPIFSRINQRDFLERIQQIFQSQLNQLLINTKSLRHFSLYSPLLPSQSEHKTQTLQLRPPPLR